jgi:hypothetical protein
MNGGIITMKKSHLLGATTALPFLVMTFSANADLIASDDSSITWTDQWNVQTIAASTSSFPGIEQTVDMPGDPGQKQLDENFNFFRDGNSSESETPHSDSHASLWLLLIAVAVAGTLSEILYRKSFNR